jgi:hypothetical protein
MNKTALYILIFSSSFLWTACQSEAEPEVTKEDSKQTKTDASIKPIEFDEKAIRQAVLSRLGISETDQPEVVITRAHLNNDSFEDAYINVNLAKKATKDMEAAKNPAMFVETGYLGNYNYLIAWDGETKLLGNPYQLVSNAMEALIVEEVDLLDPGYKTLAVTYRVRNSVFEIFLRIMNGSFAPVFSYKIMDGIGTDKPVFQVRKIVDNPKSVQKDIIVYEGELRDYSATEAARNKNYYPFNRIQSKPAPVARYFFDKQLEKYATEAANLMQ